MVKALVRIALLLVLIAPTSWSHNGSRPSVHDTVAGVIEKLKKTFTPEALGMLTLEEAFEYVSQEEKDILASDEIQFNVNVPVVVSVFHDVRLKSDPFWLSDRGFTLTEVRARVENREFEVWEKEFEAGLVGLGVNSLSGSGEGYFVALQAKDPAATIEVTGMYPGQHTLGVLEVGANVHYDDDAKIRELPESMTGRVLVRGSDERADDARIVGIYQITPYPSSDSPDHVVLTWSGDPKTTQTIQWRTGPRVHKGYVQYQKKSEYKAFSRSEPMRVQADSVPMETELTVNDPRVVRHTVVLTDLEPDTTYVYCVGNGDDTGWTELAEFTTAPDSVQPFTFIYMGDAQNGLERWGSLVQNSFLERPDAAFYIMAGDLVNRGAERYDWDTFFENAEGVFDRRTLVPCLGNHEYQGENPQLYLDLFTLPTNGSTEIGPEQSYAFEYSNTLFVILDSNVPPASQSAWLEEQLANTKSTWKIVVYHHPAYSSGANRDNPTIREVWGAIFDKYHVDLALQGHDHAYLRTYPMKAGQRVETAKDGTIYIVSVSGTKFYEQGDFDYTEFGMTNVATYQVLDIQISGDRLVYRAYDVESDVRDKFIIEK